MDSKSFWLVGRLVDTGKSDYNCRITCFNCFDPSCASQRVSDGLITFISGSSRTL